MWTEAARKQHAPRKERYPSDLTDAEWALIAPLIPPGRRGGRPRETDMREVMNAVRYVLRTGCQWRQLPKDFPPRSTVYSYFWEWSRYGVLDRIHHTLLMACREAEGRYPTAADAHEMWRFGAVPGFGATVCDLAVMVSRLGWQIDLSQCREPGPVVN